MASRINSFLACIVAGLACFDTLFALEADPPVLISFTPTGMPTGGLCWGPKLSHTGRFVTYSCFAVDIVPGEPGIGDAMLYDAQTREITGLSLTSEGAWGDCLGAELGTCTSRAIGIADDGRQVVLHSGAPLLPELPVPLDAGYPNVFLRDVVQETTVWLTPVPAGAIGNGGPQGQDAATDRTEFLFTTSINYLGGPDSNGWAVDDLFLKNWTTGVVELISVSPAGEQADGSTSYARFSPDGRYVVFLSSANNLTGDNPQHFRNWFLRDRQLATTRRLTFPWQGGEFTSQPNFLPNMQITTDNRHVVFSATGTELSPDADPNVSVGTYDIDLVTGVTRLISRGLNGEVLNESVFSSVISADGRYLAFFTAATNLMADPGPLPAVFVQDRWTGETVNVSATVSAGSLNGAASGVALSADGSTLAFDWITYNATYPTLADNQQVYVVALRGPAPAITTPVPSLSWIACAIFAVVLMFAAFVSRDRLSS